MNIQGFIDGLLLFIENGILPTLVLIAFFFFVWNAARYFIFESTSEEGQAKAKSFALWGIIAFVFISSIWGIVSLFTKGIGLNEATGPTPDYMCDKTGGDCADKNYTFTEPFYTFPADRDAPDIDASINNDVVGPGMISS